MSMFKVDVAIGNLDGGDLAPVQPVVDTGAAHSMLPESLMTHVADRTRISSLGFILADGSPGSSMATDLPASGLAITKATLPGHIRAGRELPAGRVDSGGVQPGGRSGGRAVAAGGVAVAGLGRISRKLMSVRVFSAGCAIRFHLA